MALGEGYYQDHRTNGYTFTVDASAGGAQMYDSLDQDVESAILNRS